MEKILNLAASLLAMGVAAFPAEANEMVEKGAYLTAAAGCQACHTDPKEKQAFAGGRPLKTPFGIFYSPNITPDSKSGIGNWTEEEFIKAVKQGISPEGSHYFPAFPYTSYAKMTDQDAKAIFAYLRSLSPIERENRDHEIVAPFSWRWLQTGWKLLFFDDKTPAPLADKKLDRGRYLVDALGHCGECHTPRNSLGGLDQSRYLAGMAGGGEGELVSNITPDPKTGIGDWSTGDMVSFLETGMKPDFDDVQGSMEEVISHGTSKLTKEDREAMAEYLRSITPIENKISR
ncbi:MAG: cytochrome c [Sneathiellales bacterium]|nr:cytochrome c [Sneathiellales bacterium]